MSTPTQLACEDGASLLVEEIRQIDEAISRLMKRKVNALVQLNAVRTPYRNLPDEVLSEIFRIAGEVDSPPFSTGYRFSPGYNTPSREFFFALRILGAVCSRWRRVAWSTQRIWTYLGLDVNDALRKHNFALPRTYFRNAGNRPMTVLLDCERILRRISLRLGPSDGPGIQGYETTLELLRSLIFLDYPQKIAHLRLNCPPPEWLPFLTNSFVALRRLELGWPYRTEAPHQMISLTELCSLEEVVINRIYVNIELPWEQIKYLDITGTCFEVAARLLISCPNLVKYYVKHLRGDPPADPISWLPASQITLPHLEIFYWQSWRPEARYAQLFGLLNFPSLRHIHWSEDEDRRIDNYRQHSQAVGLFFERLPTAHLRRLDLYGFGKNEAEERLSTILNNILCRLRQLSLHEGSRKFSTIAAIASILHKAQQEGRQIFPDLEHLTLDVSYPDSEGMEGIVSLIQESRACGVTDFCLEIVDLFDKSECWSSEIRARFNVMVQEGFKLKVLAGGKMVSWLSQDSQEQSIV